MMLTDKKISVEAAKLLGVAFTWSGRLTMRFIHSQAGVRVRTYDEDRGVWDWDEAYRGKRVAEAMIVAHWFEADGLPYIVEGLPTDDVQEDPTDD